MLNFSHRVKDGVWKVCFFIDFLRYSFGRITAISTVVEREYTPDIAWQICFAYQLTGFYMIRGFNERCFLTDYSRLYNSNSQGDGKFVLIRVRIVGSSSSLTKFCHFFVASICPYLKMLFMLFGALVEKGWVKNVKIHSSLNSNLLLWEKT